MSSGTLREMASSAQRWARSREAISKPGPVIRVVVADVLSADERERLFAWVRSELTQAPVSRTMAARNFYLAERLGLTIVQADALRRESGWPAP